MALISSVNQYSDINTHFQSYAQNARDGWSSFHAAHVVHLADAIARLLPSGYEVAPEASLQIRLYDPVATRPAVEMSDRTQRLSAVLIYAENEPVTRLEILSPTNKQDKEKRGQYLAKRAAALETGTVLVEVDYLHQSPSLLPDMPDYAKKESGAYPYTITVTDPCPTLEEGYSYIYGFRVDEPLPPIRIPLAREDSISLDFNAVYNHTFGLYSYYYKHADYTREPMAFDSYLKIDQIRIWQRMVTVIEAKKAGGSLSTAPLPVGELVPALDWLQNTPYKNASLLVDNHTLEMGWLVQQENNLLFLAPDAHIKKIAHQTYAELKAVFEEAGFAAFLGRISD